ncbi:metallophosphoesterase [Moheibacter stercoris]|uniref:Serine/threonine protein phosphatase 1 n=1 Tax=Moheibacter stercoris TaxID=1628251 RepID=A0ABV2LT36_9FLAO
MKHFIIGDIHGCYFTLQEMLKNWDVQNEKLVLLGDYVNKGKHSFAVLEFLLNLQKSHPEKTVILKGNNEYLFEEYYRDSINLATKQKFEMFNMNYLHTLDWMQNLPHFYENGVVYATHAGIAEDVNYPIEQDEIQVLFNRKPLKNIQKLQFLGHIVVDEPEYDPEANAWYMDTGAGLGKKLSGVKVSENGEIEEMICLKIHEKDKAK